MVKKCLSFLGQVNLTSQVQLGWFFWPTLGWCFWPSFLTNRLFDPWSNVTCCKVILMSHVSSFDTNIIGQILVCHMAYDHRVCHMACGHNICHVAHGYNICHVAYHIYLPTYVHTYLSTFLQSIYLHIGWIGLPTYLCKYPPSSSYQPR